MQCALTIIHLSNHLTRQRMGCSRHAPCASNIESLFTSRTIHGTANEPHQLDPRDHNCSMELPGIITPNSIHTYIFILTMVLKHDNGTLFNVIDDSTSFGDTASTTLLASVTYRMAAFTNDSTLLPYANKALNLAKSSVDTNGWLLNTVDPLTFTTPSVQGSYSPEGQAFVLLLHSAWRDYVQFISNSSSTAT